MIIIKVELHSAIDGKVTQLGWGCIRNDGTGTPTSGNYTMEIRGQFNRLMRPNMAVLKGWPRRSKHVWALVARMLQELYPSGH